MTDTTTIQVRRDQAKRLKEIQGPSGNYKTALDALLETYAESEETTLDAADYERIADEVVRRLR